MLNSLGQVGQRGQAQPRLGQLTATLDGSRRAAGIYTVRLLTGEGPVTKPLIRE